MRFSIFQHRYTYFTDNIRVKSIFSSFGIAIAFILIVIVKSKFIFLKKDNNHENILLNEAQNTMEVIQIDSNNFYCYNNISNCGGYILPERKIHLF